MAMSVKESTSTDRIKRKRISCYNKEAILEARKHNFSDSQIADMLKIGVRTVKTVVSEALKEGRAKRKELPKKVDEKIRQEILKCKENRLSDKEVALKFGIHRTLVGKIWRESKSAQTQEHLEQRVINKLICDCDSSSESESKNFDADVYRKYAEHLNSDNHDQKKRHAIKMMPCNAENDSINTRLSTLLTRFHIAGSDYPKYQRMSPELYRLLLFRLRRYGMRSLLLKKRKLPLIQSNRFCKLQKLMKKKPNDAHALYSYRCPDCWFELSALQFVPIVYIIIDHFLDCKDHRVVDDVRQLFLTERESFNAFLGADFNHAFSLPKSAVLKFFAWHPLDTFHTSLQLPGFREINTKRLRFLATAIAHEREEDWETNDEQEENNTTNDEQEENNTTDEEYQAEVFFSKNVENLNNGDSDEDIKYRAQDVMQPEEECESSEDDQQQSQTPSTSLAAKLSYMGIPSSPHF